MKSYIFNNSERYLQVKAAVQKPIALIKPVNILSITEAASQTYVRIDISNPFSCTWFIVPELPVVVLPALPSGVHEPGLESLNRIPDHVEVHRVFER